MRGCEPFLQDDLTALDSLLSQATAVVAMEDIHDGVNDPTVIGLRHDVDNEIHSSVEMARWEHDRGYRSTYYILHTAPYWQEKLLLRESLETIAACGHEIGIHNDALSVAIVTGRDPDEVLREAIDELCGYGHRVRSTVAHGNRLCHIAHYVNDELFQGCGRPEYGSATRTLEVSGRKLQLRPRSLSAFGLDFDANWLHRADYLSDSGGRWSQAFDDVAAGFPGAGQLHLLVHPCWWAEAFEREKAAA